MRDASSLQEARAKAVEQFPSVAAALKAEAGVNEHIIRGSLSGCAFQSGKIAAPEGRSRKQLYILAHECAHIALRHCGARSPRHVQEMEAEKWAHAALRRHGIAVPRAMTDRAKRYVQRKIQQAKRNGAKRIDKEAAAFARAAVLRLVPVVALAVGLAACADPSSAPVQSYYQRAYAPPAWSRPIYPVPRYAPPVSEDDPPAYVPREVERSFTREPAPAAPEGEREPVPVALAPPLRGVAPGNECGWWQLCALLPGWRYED